MKVLFTKDYGKEKFDKIRELGYEIMYYNENIVTNNEDVDSADILVTYNPFRTLDINKMENLKYIQTTSIGIDQIPVDKILNRDIVIANNKGGYSIPIAKRPSSISCGAPTRKNALSCAPCIFICTCTRARS